MDMTEMIMGLNDLHSHIKQLKSNNPEKFEESGFSDCGHCNGTGLKSGKDIHHACKQCKGIGFVGFTELFGETICPDCNSSGKELRYENHVVDCETCEGAGRLDWIDAVKKGISLEKIGW